MDCKAAQALFAFARPLSAELDTAEAEAVRDHVSDCPDCAPLYQAERRVDDHVARAMRAVPMPDDLQNRLVDRLRRERRKWYTKRIVVPSLATAAAVLIATFIGLQLRPARPGADLAQWYLGPTPAANASAQSVEDSIQQIFHIHTVAPRQFNYAFLDAYTLAPFEGKAVPMLSFVRGQATAKVYILSADDFDLEKIRPPEPPGSYPVELLRGADHRFVYVVVYSGDGLDAFLLKGPESAT